MYARNQHPDTDADLYQTYRAIVSLDELMARPGKHAFEPSQEKYDDDWEELRGLAAAGAIPEPALQTGAPEDSSPNESSPVVDLLELTLLAQLGAEMQGAS